MTIDTRDNRIGPQGRDDDLTRALRALYAVPATPEYWNRLEARILARVAGEEDGWWSPFRHWVRPGLVAAALAAVAVGFALARSRDLEARVAVQTIVDTPRTAAQELATQATDRPRGDSVREATLRYLIAP